MGPRGPIPNRSRYEPCGLAHPRRLLCQEKTACVVQLGDPTCINVRLVQDLRGRTRRPIHVPKNTTVAPTFARTTPTPDRRSALLLDHADRRATAVLQHEVGQLVVKRLVRGRPRTLPCANRIAAAGCGRLRRAARMAPGAQPTVWPEPSWTHQSGVPTTSETTSRRSGGGQVTRSR